MLAIPPRRLGAGESLNDSFSFRFQIVGYVQYFKWHTLASKSKRRSDGCRSRPNDKVLSPLSHNASPAEHFDGWQTFT